MLPNKTARILTLFEGFAFAIFIGMYIWWLQLGYPKSWMVIPIWLVASFVIHRDTPKTLGWRADNLWAASSRAAVVFGICIAVVGPVGFFLGALQRMPEHFLDSHRFLGYFAFCLLQQIALNSYLTNRFLFAVENTWVASLLASVVFALLHWPNPVLVPLTLVGGFLMSWLFARERNILPLTLGQALLGGVVWWAFPLAWHHSMRVGPGYYTFTNHLR